MTIRSGFDKLRCQQGYDDVIQEPCGTPEFPKENGVNRTLVRQVIYPAYRWIKRDNLFALLTDMRRTQRASPDEIRDLQWSRLKLLLDHACKNVPYYRRIFRDIGLDLGDLKRPEDLSALPLLRKQDIRNNLNDLIAENVDRRFLHPDETGGSTGQNLFFYGDRRARAAALANFARMNEWAGVRVGDRTAILWGTRFRVSSSERIKAAIHNWVTNTVYISAYRMDAETLGKRLATLRRFRPDMLIGYPSSLYHLAGVVADSDRGRLKPRAIMTSGETLYDWQRSAIEEAFGSSIYNHYGCCEFGAMARECTVKDGLHIAAELLFVETVPVARSSSGEEIEEMVITGLDNYGMPLIRYAIEDLGSITWEPCACGLTLPRIKKLSGRVYDVIRAPNGNFLGGTFWGHILKEGVERFQVVQDKIDEVTISLVPTSEFSETVKAYVLEKVRDACGETMKVQFEVLKDLPVTPAGKHRYVISKIPIRK